MSAATEHRNAKATEAALQNEQITRERVDHLESWAEVAGPAIEDTQKQLDATTHIVGHHMDFMSMPLWERLRWLLTGKGPRREIPTE